MNEIKKKKNLELHNSNIDTYFHIFILNSVYYTYSLERTKKTEFVGINIIIIYSSERKTVAENKWIINK